MKYYKLEMSSYFTKYHQNMSLKTNMGIKSFFLDVITDWSFVLYYEIYCEDTTVKKPTIPQP